MGHRVPSDIAKEEELLTATEPEQRADQYGARSSAERSDAESPRQYRCQHRGSQAWDEKRERR